MIELTAWHPSIFVKSWTIYPDNNTSYIEHTRFFETFRDGLYTRHPRDMCLLILMYIDQLGLTDDEAVYIKLSEDVTFVKPFKIINSNAEE